MKILEEFIIRHLKKSKIKVCKLKWDRKNKEKNKKYRERTKEHKKKYNDKWRKNNKEKQQIYSKNNKYRLSRYHLEWSKKNESKVKISQWKRMGLISNDYDLLFNKWKNTKNCENCNMELTDGNLKTSRCLDHSHITGEYRNILCKSCNVKRGETNI